MLFAVLFQNHTNASNMLMMLTFPKSPQITPRFSFLAADEITTDELSREKRAARREVNKTPKQYKYTALNKGCRRDQKNGGRKWARFRTCGLG